MFGFFKKDVREIDALKFQMLATAATSNSFGVAISLMATSAKRDDQTWVRLYYEVLAFATCLAQMAIQKKYKLEDPNQIVVIIEQLQWQYAKLRPFEHEGIKVTKEMLSVLTEDDFFILTAHYAARDYKALGISEELFEGFCKMTNLSPSMLRGAGWTLALVILQMRTSGLLFENPFQMDINPFLKCSREGCNFIREKFDRLL